MREIMNRQKPSTLLLMLALLTGFNINHVYAESCQNNDAIEMYNQANDTSDLNERLTLLKTASEMCSTDETILSFLGDTQFELEQYKQSAMSYQSLFQLKSDAPINEQAKVALDLMYIYDKLEDGLAISKYAKFIKEQKYNGLNWSDEYEKSFQKIYQKNKQRMTDKPVSAGELSTAISNAKTNARNFGIVGIESIDCISWDMDVYFDYNSDALTNKSKQTLNKFVTTIQANVGSIDSLTINGHTDSRGSTEYNQQLSQRRAKAVASYLAKAIPTMQDKLVANGFGESQLIFNDDSEKSHALNRRVEFDLAIKGAECQ